MDRRYPVMLNGKNVGTAEIIRQGLYNRILCCCWLPESRVYALWVLIGKTYEKLGVCVPTGDHFSVDIKIPVKRFLDEELSFITIPNSETPTSRWITISQDQPFYYLRELTHARFEIQNSCGGIIIQKIHDPEE